MTAVDPEGRIRHPLDVFHSTYAPDGSFIAAGMIPVADGAGLVDYLDSATLGGTEVPFDLGNLGSTETLDLANGSYQRGTLNADCTITVTGFTVDVAAFLTLKLTQDGTGGWAIVWDTDVVFLGDDQPSQAAGDVSFFTLWTDEGDTTIFAAPVGGGSTVSVLDDLTDVNAPSPSNGDVLTWDSTPGEWVASPPSTVAALDDLTDVTITTPAEDDQLQYVSGEWVNNSRRWEPVTTNPGGGPELVWDGDDIVMTWRTY